MPKKLKNYNIYKSLDSDNFLHNKETKQKTNILIRITIILLI